MENEDIIETICYPRHHYKIK